MSELKHNLLIIEDEDDLRDLLTRQFTRQGFNVIATETADQAQKILESNTNFEIILSDIRLPGKLDGISLLKECRIKNAVKPFFVLMTGHMPISEKHARDLGATKLLIKPFSVAQVAAEFQFWLNPAVESAYKRFYDRIPVTTNVVVTGANKEKLLGKILNMSTGGVFLTDCMLPADSKITLEIDLEERIIRIEGQVRWSRANYSSNLPMGVGLQFVNIEKDQEDMIREYLRNVPRIK